MAPVVVGDYITFSGQQVGAIFEVNNLVVNAGFYTAPGTQPAYITVDNMNYGITFPATPDAPETRAVAMVTDPTTTVQWFAMDQDPCFGNVTERNLLLLAPSTIAPIGRCIFRMGKTDVSPATRNVGFRYSNGVVTQANGLVAGQFIQPVFNFIFPEIVTFGANVPELAFDHMPFLAAGSGPYVPGNVVTPPLANPPIIGPLSPWPGANTPVPPQCPTVTSAPSSTSSTPSATPTPTPVPDTITITSATKVKDRGGAFVVTVNAKSNNPAATLQLAVAGPNPLPASPMTRNPDGTFSLTVSVKGTPTSVTVTSQFGGSATSAV
jgi:hypothetical protein